jgi:hypothetical protein
LGELLLITVSNLHAMQVVRGGTMSGQELIDWAVRQCERENIPPTDAAILAVIRRVAFIVERNEQ